MKKLLALVLALVMTLSLCVVSSNAAYAGEEFDYKEAVDVMTAAGVFQGDENGKFNPTGILTREQAAKIVTYMLLGKTAADALVTIAAPFADVAADRWSAGSIAYCYNEGILAGVGNGMFAPTAELTGLAFAKMMLVALGYDAENEGLTGAQWSINAAKLALTVGLTEDMDDVSLSAPMTREQAAKMAYNTELATMVEYDNNSVITAGNVTIKTSSAAKKVERSATAIDYRGGVEGANGTLQFCEKYASKLALDITLDDFGRPADKWEYKGVKVGTYAETPDLTYTEAVKGKTIYADLGKGAFAYYDDDADTNFEADEFIRFVDGYETDNTYVIAKTEEHKFGGQGVLTEVYYDSTSDNVVVVEINTYLATVVGDFDEKNETLAVTFQDSNPGASETLDLDDLDNLKEFKNDDVVLLTVAYDYDGSSYYVASIAAAEVVTATVENYTIDVSVTANGTTRKYNETATTTDDNTYTIGNSYKLYVDTYGNVLKTKAVEAEASQYVFVTETTGYGLSAAGDVKAAAYFTDGTYEAITVSKINGSKVSGASTNRNAWYTFTEKDGKYELTTVSSNIIAYNENDNDEQVAEKGEVLLNIGAGTSKGTNKTIFITVDANNKVKAYTGIKNVPDIKAAAASTTYSAAVENSNGYAKYVFIVLGDATATNVNRVDSDLIYVLDASYKTAKDADKNDYYIYDAIVNGEKTKMNASVHTFSVGLYTDVDHDGDGYVSGAQLLTTANTDDAADPYYGDFVTLAVFTDKNMTTDGDVLTIEDSGSFDLANGAKIYVIDENEAGEITVSTTSAASLANKYKTTDCTAVLNGVIKDGEYTALYLDLVNIA